MKNCNKKLSLFDKFIFLVTSADKFLANLYRSRDLEIVYRNGDRYGFQGDIIEGVFFLKNKSVYHLNSAHFPAREIFEIESDIIELLRKLKMKEIKRVDSLENISLV